MYGYVFQYTNDNVDIGSDGTNLNTDSYGLALWYETKLRDDFFTDSVIGFNLLHIDHQRVTLAIFLKGDREGQTNIWLS